MNLRQIEVFRAIMMTGSVSSAARLLAISQPAVSRILKQTETRLKVPLFVRRAGRLQPTPEAQRLYGEVEKVYEGVQRVEALAKDLTKVKSGQLRVFSTPSVGHSLIPRAIARFHREYPGVRVLFDVLIHRELVDAVVQEKCDLGVSLMPASHPVVEDTLLAEARLLCVMREDHPLASAREISIEQVLQQPMILQGADTPIGGIISQYLSVGKGDPIVTCEVRINWVACSLVQWGVGIAIVDEFSVDIDMWPDIVAIPLRGGPALKYQLVSQNREPTSVIAKAFIHMLRQEVADRRAGRP
mgnify:CR=1 FL=1